MVQLYLIRHGVTEPRGERWREDGKRPLSESGVTQMRKGARGLERLGADLDLILTSPLARTTQTAHIVAAAFKSQPPVVETSALAPAATYPALLAELGKHERYLRIGLVGHEPALGDFARRLTRLGRRLDFKKGAVCRIDVDQVPPETRGDLRWFVTPAILRAIKG